MTRSLKNMLGREKAAQRRSIRADSLELSWCTFASDISVATLTVLQSDSESKTETVALLMYSS